MIQQHTQHNTLVPYIPESYCYTCLNQSHLSVVVDVSVRSLLLKNIYLLGK